MNLESLGLLGLFIGTFLAATILPFSSDALYIAVLAAVGDAGSCLLVGTFVKIHGSTRWGRKERLSSVSEIWNRRVLIDRKRILLLLPD